MYQNAKRYKGKENAFINNCKCGLLSPVFIIKLGGGGGGGEYDRDLFSRTTEERQGHEGLTESVFSLT